MAQKKKKELKIVLSPIVKNKSPKNSEPDFSDSPKVRKKMSESPKRLKKEKRTSKPLETIASEEVMFDQNKVTEQSPSSG